MVGRVVGGAVLPAVPDGVEPGAGQDAHGVGVVVSSGDGAVVAVGGPEVGSAAVTGEVADGVAELFVCGPTESDVFDFAGLTGGGATPARQANDSGVGKRARQSPISASSRAARTVPERGREVKICASACKESCSAICASSVLIWVATLVSAATMARVMWALAAPSSPVAPRGAPVSRSWSTAAVASGGQPAGQALDRQPVRAVLAVETGQNVKTRG